MLYYLFQNCFYYGFKIITGKMTVKEIKVGIIGFGTVGAGVAANILANSDVIASRTGVKLVLAKVADLDITTDRGVRIPEGVLTTDAAEAIREADIVVELVGGTTVAKKFILDSIRAGKPVVTANKALLALHGEEIFAAAEAAGVDVYYEASVAGGIPIIKALREGLVSNRIHRIYGIMNGTCNYILTRMENEGADFSTVLADAQKLGYAEANPSLDIDGFDTAHKTAILAALAFGEWFGLDPVHVEGIRDLELADLRYAEELGYRIKLLAVIKESDGDVQMSVRPTLIPRNTLLANISDVFNGVLVEGDTVGQTLFYGRGAGWQRQLHIYECPFYYIDYCLSTMAALQFFLLSLHDQKDAWERYLRLVRRAGTASYTELCETAGLQVPFNDGSIKAIAQQMSQWIAEHQV